MRAIFKLLGVVGTIEERDSEGRWVVQAKEILRMIERGEDVKIENRVIKGDLDITTSSNMPKEPVKPHPHHIDVFNYDRDKTVLANSVKPLIIIRNCKMLGSVNLAKAIFHEVVIFKDTMFCGPVNLNEAIFCKVAQFHGAEFCKDARFQFARFCDGVYFGYDGVNHNNAVFNGIADFCNSIFKGTSYFPLVRLKQNSLFVFAEFQSTTRFKMAHFSNYISFTSAKFGKDSDVDFCHAKIDGHADFSNVHFLGKTNFTKTMFNGDANFSDGTTFYDDADFKDAKFKGDVTFYGTQFKKKLLIRSADFNRLRVRSWNSIKDKLDCDGPAYLLLVRSFKMQEQFENADDCYYDYREWRRTANELSKDKPSNWSKLYDMLSYLSCGYGVRPGYTLGWILVSMYIFWVIFLGCSRSIFEAVYFSFTSLTGSSTNSLPIGAWKYAVMFESVLGYLFLALFIVVLARKLIR